MLISAELCCRSGEAKLEERAMTKLKVEGMSCNHCVQAVSKALGAVAGVDRVVEVNLELLLLRFWFFRLFFPES